MRRVDLREKKTKTNPHAVAYYFAWLEHISKWMIPPAFFGFVLFLFQILDTDTVNRNDFDHPLR